LFTLRDNYTLHLYTSSQPCGNATIKKWGKGCKAVRYPHLSEGEYPRGDHPRLQVSTQLHIFGFNQSIIDTY
jgi:double-stranded RNA-specific adenosine deaminase